jgi:hypothetical protein
MMAFVLSEPHLQAMGEINEVAVGVDAHRDHDRQPAL